MSRQRHDNLDPNPPVSRQLSRPIAGPDQTTAIMSRLGYARCSPGAARRFRRLRLARGTLLVLAAAGVLGAGIHVYRGPLAVRTPSGPTIPAALHNDVQRQQDQIESVLRTLKRLAPPPRPAVQPDKVEPAVDPAAIAPVRWI